MKIALKLLVGNASNVFFFALHTACSFLHCILHARLRTVYCMLVFVLYTAGQISEAYHLPVQIADGSFRILMGTLGVKRSKEYIRVSV